jgi:DNA-binding LacI/PurR family transcriptional regulator
VIEEMLAHRVEGIMIAPVSDRSKSHLQRLAKYEVEFVLIDRTVSGIESDVVTGDNVGGARRLVDHLISLGHLRIGFITESADVSTARDRREASRALAPPAFRTTRADRARRSTVRRLRGMRRLLELTGRLRQSSRSTTSCGRGDRGGAAHRLEVPTTLRSSASTTSSTPRGSTRS